MDFLTLCGTRYSCRAYSGEAPSAEQLAYIKECARLAPSAVNRQPWRVRYVVSKEGLQKVRACYDREWFAQAPAVMVVTAQKDAAWRRANDGKYHGDVDAAILTEHICLAASQVGLGTCWVCNFDAARLATLLALDAEEEAVALIPIGVPAQTEIPEKKRKEITEIWTEC